MAVNCPNCGKFISYQDQITNDGYCHQCRLKISDQTKKNMEEFTMKASTVVIIVLVFLVIVLGFGVFFMGYYKDNGYVVKDLQEDIAELQDDKQTDSANANPTVVAPAAPATAPTTSNEDTVLVSTTGWEKGETRKLIPNNICIGDVQLYVDEDVDGKKDGKKEWVIYYDEGGSGESTIVVNLSSQDVSIYSEYAAGSWILNDNYTINGQIDKLVSDELSKIDKNGHIVFNKVRLVIIHADGTVTQEYKK